VNEPHQQGGDAAFDDLDSLAVALERCAPDAGAIAPLKKLGSGFFSLAVETASGVVFRLGLIAEVKARHDMEASVLPWLSGHLPLPLPRPEWSIPPDESFPHGAMGYRKLPGIPITPEVLARADQDAIASQLGNFIFALEQVPASGAIALGAPGPNSRASGWERTRDAVLPVLRPMLDLKEYREVERFWHDLLRDPGMRFQPVFTHGDLAGDNILVDPNTSRVTGILDWEWLSVGDPAQNFRGVYHDSNPGFHRKVFAAFEAAGGRLDEGIEYRLQRDRQVSTFYGILFAARRRDEQALATLIGRLRERGVLQTASDQRVT
jgi:aminoglycoside phosphotransferase (APT) family kinase protein